MEELNQRLANLKLALQIEQQNEVDVYKFSLQQQTIQERVKLNQTLYPIGYVDVKYSRFGEGLIEFSVHQDQDARIFSNGNLVEVFSGDDHKEKGVIYKVLNHSILIQIDISAVQDWIKKGKIGINKLPDTKTFDTYISHIKSIEASDYPHQIKLLYGQGQFSSVDRDEKGPLNASQNVVVNSILNQDNTVTVIHGPPGTGKTTTLVQSILELVAQNKKVLVCAPTNIAIDNIALKLLEKKIKCCRIGNPVKIDADLQNITLDGLAEKSSTFKLVEQLKKQLDTVRKKAFKYKRNFGKSEFDERKRLKQEIKLLRQDIRKFQKDIYAHIFEDANVVCGTFIGVLSENLSKLNFDYVVIDEAGQSIEPAIWAVSKLAPNLVLAGDHFQLPPFVQSPKAVQLGLNKTILDVAVANQIPTQLLNVQYRMHHKIMSFSNDYFYQSKLVADASVENWTIPQDEFEPIEFIDTAGCGFEEIKNENSGGISNPDEVKVLLKRLNNLDLSHLTYGIISPYRHQVKILEQENLKHVNTIDSFQGQERDVILISLVRNNQLNEIGFLKDYRRMNVAMTRAKKKLIIIGDSTTIGQDKFYAKLLDYIEQNGSYRSAWEFI